MNNSEDQTLKLPSALDPSDVLKERAITLDDLYVEFLEERAANRLFLDEMRELLSQFVQEVPVNFERVFQPPDAIEPEPKLSCCDLNKIPGAQLCFETRLAKLEEEVAWLKAA